MLSGGVSSDYIGFLLRIPENSDKPSKLARKEKEESMVLCVVGNHYDCRRQQFGHTI